MEPVLPVVPNTNNRGPISQWMLSSQQAYMISTGWLVGWLPINWLNGLSASNGDEPNLGCTRLIKSVQGQRTLTHSLSISVFFQLLMQHFLSVALNERLKCFVHVWASMVQW